jgi:hypothetical protein
MISPGFEPIKGRETIMEKSDLLMLVNLSDKSCMDWLDAVRSAGQPWHGEVVADLEKAKVLLEEHARTHALICYDTPEREIAHDIAKGRMPSQALANWLHATNSLLEFYREHYQCLTLVCRAELEPKSKALLDKLSERSGIALGRIPLQEQNQELEIDSQTFVLQWLLSLHALQDPRAQCLIQELEASSLPLSGPACLLDMLDDAYVILQRGWVSQGQQHTLESEVQKLQSNLKQVQKENDLVIEQLHKTQEQLEPYLVDGKSDVKKLLQDIKRKNEKLHTFSRKNKQLAAKLQAARQELNDLRNSKSWKVTAPLRKTVGMFRGNKS